MTGLASTVAAKVVAAVVEWETEIWSRFALGRGYWAEDDL
jgi:hypothetical protein